MALHDGWSINTVENQEEEETPLLLKQTKQLTAPRQCCSARYNLAFMMFFGFAVVYGLRVNLSVAMVAMVNTTNILPSFNASELNECPAPSPTSNSSSENTDQPNGVPKYPWDPQTQGYLLSAFFFGYLFTQIPGGYLSGRFGGRKFLGGGVLGTAILTILTPFAAQLGVNWLYALRALEGFGEGVTFPAMMALWACWAPPLERGRLTTISGAGGNFGAFIAFPLTGFICHSLGWPAVFYCCGGAGCIWALLWFIMVSDEPRTHPRISDEEKEYIITSIGGSHGWSVPLRSMVCSGPLWAIILTQMCSNWSYYTLLTSLPTYMDTVLHFDLRQNSFLSALPYLGGWLFSVLSGALADKLLEKEIMSITTIRKLFTFAGLILPAGLLVAVGFAGCSGVLAVTFLTLSTTLGGFSAAGVFINQLDIAPQYAGILLGITNTFGTLPGVAAPMAVGYLTNNHTLMGWRTVFYVSAGVSGFGALYYSLFGNGEIQSWALRENQTQGRTETETERKH